MFGRIEGANRKENLIGNGWTTSPNGARRRRRTPGAEPSSDGQKELEEFGEDGVGHLRELSP